MKKILIHAEYMCILNLIALPFLVKFFNEENFVFWLLILFLGVAEIFLVDERDLIGYLMKKQYNKETLRIKVYLVAVVCFYVYIAFAQSWILALLLLGIDALSSVINDFLHKHIHKLQ